MRRTVRSVPSITPVAALAFGLAACSIPDTAFHATPTGGDAGAAIDTPSAVLSIIASAAAVMVDEGAMKDFTVALSQPPSAALTVTVATAAMTKLGLSTHALSFTPGNFDRPQTVALTGLADRDTVDERADVTLSAPGVDPVTLTATVHDLDKLSLITDAGATSAVQIDEGTTATVHVHLSAQPTGDVSVSALLGTGPVTVSPSMRVFTQANYDVDQAFTFTAVSDSNTVSEDQSLTLRATGVPDKLLSIHDVDKDVQNIKVTASTTTITEGAGAATLGVSLTQQPSTSVTVTVATTTHQARVDAGQLTFTPQNYATVQSVQVDAPTDPDTVDGSDTIDLKATDPDSGTVLERTVAMSIHDPDVQHILEDAPSPLPITETTMATFNVALQFKPAQTTTISVTSLDTGVMMVSPASLVFTPANYNVAQAVTVTGVHDSNLTTDTRSVQLLEAAIGTVNVPVKVTDVDHQAIVLGATSLSVPEGGARTFDVSLRFDPGASVTVTLANDNQAALPISLAPSPPPASGMLSIPFTSANYATPVRVTVSPPVDSNSASETATVTASGAGATASPTITLTTADSTVIQPWGWPTPFSTTTQVSGGFAIAYPINVGAVANLEAFHVYVPTGIGLFRMALYTDVSGKPGHLVAQMGDGKVMVDRTNDGPPLASAQLTSPTYWLAVRFSSSVNIGYDLPGASVNRCISNSRYSTISEPWVTDFTDVTCGGDHLFNIWITTYHQ
jgi:hypothetical protein